MSKPIILYADDDLASLRIVDELSTEGNFDVITVTSGEDLLRHLEHNPDRYTAVLVDMSLGIGQPGNIIADKVLDIKPKMPVAILSGYDATFISDVNPNVEYWYKPDYTNEQLLEKIHKLIDKAASV